jgi:hypothetical protein
LNKELNGAFELGSIATEMEIWTPQRKGLWNWRDVPRRIKEKEIIYKYMDNSVE